MLDNKVGGYRVLPGGIAYCTGIVPHDGFEVVRVQLQNWLPLADAYVFIENYLRGIGRPVQSFCGIEMRVPAQLTPADWSSFNTPYLEQLKRWGLLYGDLSAVCRSNIALALNAPEHPSMCAFSFTAPTSARQGGFCLSGTADIMRDGTVVEEGDTSPAAMAKRAKFTIDTIGTSLTQAGLTWTDVNQLAIFHVAEIPKLLSPELLGGLGNALRNGVLEYYARPPIVGGEVELEARGARREIVLAN
ncbi:hypothetical protein CYJ10_30870 [Cupriavidus pauculus]|uniref:RidA family protein n=2 Tax=Cupriavidus pauculus TaxID=82633 RepID=A0A2N5C3K4_9BURK|nr:hypothetical protein CYJ10_30870 [Cupriavidus pauculus]